MYKRSFPPITPVGSKLLILGSLPGDRSIAENQYYAHPQNRFWKTMALLFDDDYPLTYSDKINFLHQKNIALWDVCETAHRVGSMDTDILEEVPNAIPQLLNDYPTIRTICFNGQKAEKLYDKYFKRSKDINYLSLPSSSPANASFNQDRLLAKWKVLLPALS